jgi:nitroreductase
MDLEQAVRTRRTHKAYRQEPVDRRTLDDLFELARFAPNHHLTNPWRFRVIGPATLARLKELAEAQKPGSGRKLDRAPTLVDVSARQTGDAAQDREDLLAGAVAAYIVLLVAHGRGLAGYWRTLSLLDEPAGRDAVGLDGDEAAIGLLHLGRAVHDQEPPARAAVAEIATYLD